MGHSFDILTFDFLLKPPQPVTGLFFLSLSLFPLNQHHSHQILWVGSYLFCSDGTLDSHWKGPKITFKVYLVYHN